MNPISNQRLALAQIPVPDGDLASWGDLAHTLNGYAELGEGCARLHHNNSAKCVTELRCVLFFVARADRHNDGSFDHGPEVRELSRRIPR